MKKTIIFILAFSLTMLLVSCQIVSDNSAMSSDTSGVQTSSGSLESASSSNVSASTSAQTSASASISEPEPRDYVTDTLNQYRSIIENADSYDFHPDSSPYGECEYTLVQMKPDDTLPTLLLKQEALSAHKYVLAFYSDPQTHEIIQTSSSITLGSTASSYILYELGMQVDGNGLSLHYEAGDDGSVAVYRVTLDHDSWNIEEQWSETGTWGIEPEELRPVDLEWYNVNDTDALDNWTAQEEPGQDAPPAA